MNLNMAFEYIRSRIIHDYYVFCSVSLENMKMATNGSVAKLNPEHILAVAPER